MRQALHDLASLTARLGVGGIFFANGWHKLEAGLTATGDQFATLGAPAPGVWGAATMLMELVGGALLVAGLAVPICGLLLFAEAVAVFFMAGGEPGLPLTGGDVSLIVALGAASVLLAVGGAGRLSIDHLVTIKRHEAEAAEDFAAENEANDVIAALREPKVAEPAAESAPEAVTGRGRASAAEPVSRRPGGGAEPARPGRTAEAGTPVQSVTAEDPETAVDTAEFPAVRARTLDGTASAPKGMSGPSGDGDMLVAGQKDETAGQ